MTAPAHPRPTATEARLRFQVVGGADWIAMRPFGHCSWRCRSCHILNLRIENAALALDMERAAQISGRRTDGATTARREGIGWS